MSKKSYSRGQKKSCYLWYALIVPVEVENRGRKNHQYCSSGFPIIMRVYQKLFARMTEELYHMTGPACCRIAVSEYFAAGAVEMMPRPKFSRPPNPGLLLHRSMGEALADLSYNSKPVLGTIMLLLEFHWKGMANE